MTKANGKSFAFRFVILVNLDQHAPVLLSLKILTSSFQLLTSPTLNKPCPVYHRRDEELADAKKAILGS
jgi:hypothetical protein